MAVVGLVVDSSPGVLFVDYGYNTMRYWKRSKDRQSSLNSSFYRSDGAANLQIYFKLHIKMPQCGISEWQL